MKITQKFGFFFAQIGEACQCGRRVMRKNRPYLSKKRTVVRTHRFGVKQRGDVQYFFCHAKDINVYLKTTWGLGEAQNQAHHSLAPLLYQLAFLVNLPFVPMSLS